MRRFSLLHFQISFTIQGYNVISPSVSIPVTDRAELFFSCHSSNHRCHYNDPLLYAAEKAIGPKQLTEEEVRDTARRAYAGNTRLSSADIGKAIGRARRTVDAYIADLRAVNQMDLDIKIFRMHRLGIPQDRIAKRLGHTREVIRDHLAEMAVLPNPPNADLKKGFTVAQVAQKHGWPDPMAGGGVTPDTCLAMGRRCWAFDMKDRPDTRPEIEPFTWDISSDQSRLWPVSAAEEKYKCGVLIDDYLDILKRTGWYHTHIIQAPLSSQRFSPVVVSAMQKKGILGVTSRYVIILNQQGLE
jgi:hypothetical protein